VTSQNRESPAPLSCARPSSGSLLADSEYLGAAGRADALGGRSLVLHDNTLGILDLFLGAAPRPAHR